MSNSTSSGVSDYYNTTKNCTSVSPRCPVEATIYGYYPNLGANAFFCAYFATLTIVNLILAFRYKTWVFGRFVGIGCLGEMIGYIGRIIMNSNPWSNAGFEIQICTLILAPVSLFSLPNHSHKLIRVMQQSFFAAAIYITIKHMVRSIGPQFSPFRASLYPWIFMSCDLLSLVLQAVGGALAATANTPSASALGGRVMLAGIVFQVATFTFLYGLAGAFIFSLRRGTSTLTAEASEILFSKDFKIFAAGIFVASLAIYVRCVYRIAELATGWANEIMRNEDEFIVLDGV